MMKIRISKCEWSLAGSMMRFRPAWLGKSGTAQPPRQAGLRGRGWRRVIAALGLAALVLAQLGATQASDAPALVRIDLPDEAALAPLAAQGLLVYAQFTTAQGGILLAAQAGASQQSALARQDYAVQVLDPDTRGADYYLLYGKAKGLQQAAGTVDLLIVEGHQAIARLQDGDIARLKGQGIGWLPLVARPLAAPVTRQVTGVESTTTYSPVVQDMIDQVQTAALAQHVGDLSGEQVVIVNGEPVQLLTRYTPAGEPIKKATRWAYDRFQELGLPVAFDDYILPGFNLPRRNVIAQQSGLTQPERIYLLTAHMDSIASQPYSYAPGADDNASGTAGVLHIADILRGYHFGCTLRYALFTGEEQGLHGSAAYARKISQNGENVQAVLNLDMLGYNTPGSNPTFDLHTRYQNTGDLAIAGLFDSVVSTYSLGLVPQILQDGLAFSDHASFWGYGYPAILAIEDIDDFTPYYHDPLDRLSSLNLAYYTDLVKASLGTLAHMGCLLDGKLSGTLSDAPSGSPMEGARVEIWQNGQKMLTTSSQADGGYQVLLLNGDYSAVFAAPDHHSETASGVAVTAGQIVDLDRSLQPCNTVKEPAFSILPNPAAPGQQVTLSAQVSGGEAPVSYTWDFGDGGAQTGEVVTHTYPTIGTFIVTLTADNPCGYALNTGQRMFVGESFLFFPLVGR
jgi:hypothetical protein